METSNMKPPVTGATTSSFIGLNAYSEADAGIFFGRDQEIDRLYQLVKTNTLTCVFGKSGTGKTSLLNAGVFPKLRHDNCLPFRIRLEFDEKKPTLKQQVWKVLYAQIELYGFMVTPPQQDTTLWEFFHREDLWKVVTPVLVFDQFEEIFTLVKKQTNRQKEIEQLISELADLIENTIPEKLRHQYLEGSHQIDFNFRAQRAKIIFSFREDFLPEMETITARIPSVKNSRFRLTAMRGHQAFEVITKTWKGKIADAEAEKLVDYLTTGDSRFNKNDEADFDMMEIEPSLLSQVCTYLDKERIHEQESGITAGFLSKYPKDVILATIYHRALNDSIAGMAALPVVSGQVTNPVQEFIEDKLITQEGYRTRYSSDEVPGQLNPAIDILKHRYFVREEGPAIELTHDVIAGVVKEDRDRRRKVQAQKIANEKARKKAIRYFVIFAGLALIAWAASGAFSYFNVKKANHAREEKKQLDAAIAKEQKQLGDIQDKIASAARQNTAIVTTHNATIQALEDSLIEANADVVNARQLASLYKKKADSSDYYAKIANEQTLAIEGYKRMQDRFNRFLVQDRNRQDYIRMYQTHMDRILKYYNNNPDSLQYHINLIKQHREGFKKAFGY